MNELDVAAELAALADDGPEVLGVPDAPDPTPGRNRGPRPEDGPQTVTQDPTDKYDEESI